jgi:hypothetical protein
MPRYRAYSVSKVDNITGPPDSSPAPTIKKAVQQARELTSGREMVLSLGSNPRTESREVTHSTERITHRMSKLNVK